VNQAPLEAYSVVTKQLVSWCRERGYIMTTLVAAFLLVMTSIVHAQNGSYATFKSIRAAHDVALEATAQSTFWRDASPVYLEVDNYGHVVRQLRTEVRSRWTKDNLYFLFVCPYQELNLKPSPRTDTETNNLWKWDVAEVFIGSDFHNIRRYKEFEMSPQGEWIDLDINLDRPHHEDGWTWNSGFQVVAHIDRKRKIWYGAMKIPFAAIDPQSPRPGSMFRLNMFRSQGPPPNTQPLTWQAPMSDSFHVPERFGRLELVSNKHSADGQ
jgi:Carbohydrate family 9 binding domain-like